MIKRLWVKLFLIIFTILILVSIYFYFQHRSTIWNYSINELYEINDVKVEITEIYVKNYEMDSKNIFEERRASYDLGMKLPKALATPFFQLNYFYSKPYKINKKYGTIGLKGKFISDTFIKEESFETFKSNLEIEIVDDINVHYSNSYGTRHEGGKIVDFYTEGRNFPLKKLNSKLKISIKNKQQKTIQDYTIEPKFIKNVYGFFDIGPKDFD